MRIITWNANRVNRWTQLWADQLVRSLQWDVICLQETGAPDTAWTLISGAQWGTRAQRATDEMSVRRKYTYQPPGFPALLHIVHLEWATRQKNHLVMISQSASSWSKEIAGDQGERPGLGMKGRLTIPGAPAPVDILIGTVHIVASKEKAPQEVSAMVPFLRQMCAETGTQGWVLAGDFNCSPPDLLREATERVGVWYPTNFTTQQAGVTLDYVVVDATLYQTVMAVPGIGANWQLGTAASDHSLVRYIQTNGPALQII